MASISGRGAKAHHTYTLTLTETATSVAGNTSTVSYSFDLTDDANWFWEGGINPFPTPSVQTAQSLQVDISQITPPKAKTLQREPLPCLTLRTVPNPLGIVSRLPMVRISTTLRETQVPVARWLYLPFQGQQRLPFHRKT